MSWLINTILGNCCFNHNRDLILFFLLNDFNAEQMQGLAWRRCSEADVDLFCEFTLQI